MEDKEKAAKERIEEIKKRVKEIEEKTGKKIDLNKVLGALFTKENLKKGTLKFLETADKMLKEDINAYVEIGSQEKGPVKIEYGFRMRFLDSNDKNEDNKSHIKWIKKKKSKGGKNKNGEKA